MVFLEYLLKSNRIKKKRMKINKSERINKKVREKKRKIQFHTWQFGELSIQFHDRSAN